MKNLKSWFTKNYNFERDYITKYDYITLGIGLGYLLSPMESPIIPLLAIIILAHNAWKRK